jgi:hypothetical protein
LKSVIWKLLTLAAVFFILFSSGLALFIHYKGSSFDPVKEIQSLIQENQRDEALDMTEFFKENDPGNTKKMKELEEDLEYGFREKFQSFTWNGVIKGEIHNTYSSMGAVSSDLCLLGDLRDLAIRSWNYLFDRQDFDQVVMGLSVAGVGFSSAPFVNGSSSVAKSMAKYFKRMPKATKSPILKQFISGKLSPRESEKVWQLLKKTGGACPGLPVVFQKSLTQRISITLYI